MQNRIDRLEGLVLSLMTNGSQSAGTAAATRALSQSASTGSMEYPQDVDVGLNEEDDSMAKGEVEEAESETDRVAQSLGVMKVENNKSMYFGDAHWATILKDVSHDVRLLCSLNGAHSCRSQKSRTTSQNIRSSSRIRRKRSKNLRGLTTLHHKDLPFFLADQTSRNILSCWHLFRTDLSQINLCPDILIPMIRPFVSTRIEREQSL